LLEAEGAEQPQSEVAAAVTGNKARLRYTWKCTGCPREALSFA